MAVGHLFKSIIALILFVFLFSLVFGFLFKLGIILLIGLGIVYLYKKVTEK